MKRLLLATLCLSCCVTTLAQRVPGYRYEESEIAPYTMLNPLVMQNGRPVTTPAQWMDQRRPEILRLFEENVYGRTPAAARHAVMHAKVVEHNDHALDGLAVREQIELTFDPAPGVQPPASAQRSMRLLLYTPAGVHHPSPVIVGPNFTGNQSVVDDPAVQPTPLWSKSKDTGAPAQSLPAESTRGTVSETWQVKLLLARGYGVATFYYGDLEPDMEGAASYSVRQLFTRASEAQPADSWGAVGAWAWGLSRAFDYLELDPLVDPTHIAVTGHSRLGKAADWAAAQDNRFAALLSTESGHGGQSIQRRALGETVAHLEHSFPYWFAPAYAQWVGHDAEIPADGNLLLSLQAPRLLYVASAEGDAWSDPKGEFLAASSASNVYRLLGKAALDAHATMPAVDEPIGLASSVAYHERAGKHDVTRFDWEHYLDFLDQHWGKPSSTPAVPVTGAAPPPACAAQSTPPLGDAVAHDPLLRAREAPCVKVVAPPASKAQIRQWLADVHRDLYLPDPLPRPEAELYATQEIAPGVTIEKLSYTTAYGLRVPAIVYRPTSLPHGSRMPAIVVVNGHGGDKSSWYAFYTGVLYARAGAVVLTYDPIGEGERNDEHKDFTGEHDQLVPSPASMPVRLGGLMVADAMQAVSTLLARPDVDPHRIAMMGFSMGSFVASLTGAADPRIHALLLVGGGDLDGPGGIWDAGHAVMCQAAPYRALQGLGDRPAVLFTLSARRGDTYIWNGTADTVVGIPTHGPAFFDEMRQRVLALNGSPHGVFTDGFDPGASHRPSWMTVTAAQWLNQELHFSAWQSKRLDTLPTLTIGDWAKQVGLPLGKSADRQDRDAGIVALAADVPLLTAEQLNVLPRATWDSRKEDFVYSSWLKRAAAAAASE